MGAGGLLAAFSLLICLASGLMLFQGIQAYILRHGYGDRRDREWLS